MTYGVRYKDGTLVPAMNREQAERVAANLGGEAVAGLCMKRWTTPGTSQHMHLCGKDENHGPVHTCSCGAVWRAP